MIIKLVHESLVLTVLSNKKLMLMQVCAYALTSRSICCPIQEVWMPMKTRVEPGNFGHQGKFGHIFANSGNLDETAPYEPSHRDFKCLLS